MKSSIWNVIRTSLIIIFGFLVFIVILEYKFDGRYYEKDECTKAVVVKSKQVLNDTGRRAYNATVEFTSYKGNKRTGYLEEVTWKRLRKGDEVTVAYKGITGVRLVKRDIFTGKYIDIDNLSNMFCIMPIIILLVGAVNYSTLSGRKTAVNIMIAIFGVLVSIYSSVHDDDLGVILRWIGIGITVISLLLTVVQMRIMARMNARCDIGANEIKDKSNIDAKPLLCTKLKKDSKIKQIGLNISTKWSQLGNKKYYIVSAPFFIAVTIFAIEVSYCLFGTGNYGKYVCVDGVIVGKELMSETYTGEKYLLDFEYVTENGEERESSILYRQSNGDSKFINVGDTVKIGYTDEKVTIFEKDEFTGRYFPYDNKYQGDISAMGILLFVGLFIATMSFSKKKKRTIRGMGLIFMGIAFIFGRSIAKGKIAVEIIDGVVMVVGILCLLSTMLMIIKEKNVVMKEKE